MGPGGKGRSRRAASRLAGGGAGRKGAELTASSAWQGGFGILEEMCVNYVHYYPQTQLELCKSSVDPGFLQKYFHLVNR